MIKLSMAQMEVNCKDLRANLEKMNQLVRQAVDQKSDIIVFPELCTTGFNWEYNLQHIDKYPEVLKVILALSKKYGLWICASVLLPNSNGRLSNTAILSDHEGRCVSQYQKIHLFPPMMEDRRLEAGRHIKTVDTAWAKIGFAICYDLRFPELFIAYALKGVEIVFLPASFPQPRREHWKLLLRARAVENQMYMVGVNRVGEDLFEDGNRVSYFGNSILVDPLGVVVAEGEVDKEQLILADIDLDKVKKIRENAPTLQHRKPAIYKDMC